MPAPVFTRILLPAAPGLGLLQFATRPDGPRVVWAVMGLGALKVLAGCLLDRGVLFAPFGVVGLHATVVRALARMCHSHRVEWLVAVLAAPGAFDNTAGDILDPLPGPGVVWIAAPRHDVALVFSIGRALANVSDAPALVDDKHVQNQRHGAPDENR
ncbi:hypothetical protein [Lutimaribacter marinistellae]|uniref:hypothetical protein n=1 Tax=Lutimaribacter marinistellae TaxID=1820329 RepID=UPI0036D87CEC